MSNELQAQLEDLKQRVADLEEKVAEDFKFLVESFEKDQDDIYARVDLGRSEASQAAEAVSKTVADMQDRITVRLQAAVDQLIAKSSSDVVAKALHSALANTILKVRSATREELKTGTDVLVIRPASMAELRQQ